MPADCLRKSSELLNQPPWSSAASAFLFLQDLPQAIRHVSDARELGGQTQELQRSKRPCLSTSHALPLSHAQDTLLSKKNGREYHHSLVLDAHSIQMHVGAAQHSPEGLGRLSCSWPPWQPCSWPPLSKVNLAQHPTGAMRGARRSSGQVQAALAKPVAIIGRQSHEADTPGSDSALCIPLSQSAAATQRSAPSPPLCPIPIKNSSIRCADHTNECPWEGDTLVTGTTHTTVMVRQLI